MALPRTRRASSRRWLRPTREAAVSRRWVLLHGYTGSPVGWDLVHAALAPQGEVLRPALVGHAPGTGAATDFVAEVDRLAALARNAGFAGSHLCGYSLGGRLALGLLARHPGLFARATLIGAHPGLPESSAERAARAASDEAWAQLAERDAPGFFARWAAQPLFATQQALAPAQRAAQDRQREAHDAAALGGTLRALSLARMPDWQPALGALTQPVRLMAGGLDTKFSALAQRMAAQIPHATLDIVAGAGHNVVLERPGRVVDALIG
ncbi:MAG: hypothetical protein C0505_04490 [Leptothrix sp. (in: Bacteria)]|nr:hypothetical protein [Leptothrix sp. (in: b-proteobacteria)]